VSTSSTKIARGMTREGRRWGRSGKPKEAQRFGSKTFASSGGWGEDTSSLGDGNQIGTLCLPGASLGGSVNARIDRVCEYLEGSIRSVRPE
jgi:hypothetical protein